MNTTTEKDINVDFPLFSFRSDLHTFTNPLHTAGPPLFAADYTTLPMEFLQLRVTIPY